ncbi:MAG: DUF6709 family protein [Bacillota bacterium]
MEYVKTQIRRIYRNRMILTGILTGWILIPLLIGLSETARNPDSANSSAFIAVLIMAAIPFAFFLHALINRANYKSSKYYKALGNLQLGDAETVEAAVNQEAAGHMIHSVRQFTLTNHWALIAQGMSFRARPLRDLVWVYMHITRTNFGARYYALMFAFADRRQIRVQFKNEDECLVMMRLISEVCPYVVVGYSPERLRSFRSASGAFTGDAILERWHQYPPVV